MFRYVRWFVLSAITATAFAASQQAVAPKGEWRAKLAQSLPLLGHRNWILVVDSAYPLQTSPGIETVETNADQLDVVDEVLRQVNGSVHVRPIVYMDAELPFIPEADAPGVTAYISQVKQRLGRLEVQSLPHDQLIAKVDETSRSFHVLVLKTKLAIPYTSVFFQLDCKYWGADAEKRLREKMAAK
jgi:RbsD / FucU transport protein family